MWACRPGPDPYCWLMSLANSILSALLASDPGMTDSFGAPSRQWMLMIHNPFGFRVVDNCSKSKSTPLPSTSGRMSWITVCVANDAITVVKELSHAPCVENFIPPPHGERLMTDYIPLEVLRPTLFYFSETFSWWTGLFSTWSSPNTLCCFACVGPSRTSQNLESEFSPCSTSGLRAHSESSKSLWSLLVLPEIRYLHYLSTYNGPDANSNGISKLNAGTATT